MLLSMISWLFGYIVVEVVGDNVERFMNLCSVGIKDVWGYEVTERGIKANVRLSEIKSIRSIAKKAKVKIIFCQRKGLWFWLCPLKKRWGLVVGIAVFSFLLCFLSSRIWMIHIHGNQRVSTNVIQELLYQNGVSQGISSGGFDWATLRQTIISQNPDIAWMSLNPSGSVLNVDISETTKPPELNNNDFPCNGMASCDGRIVEMQVYTGTAMVKVGDAVVKGDMLISGAVEYSDGYTSFCKASGKVMAETVREHEIFIPFRYTQERPNGEVKVRRVLCCFGIEIPLYFGSVSPPYTKETTQRYVTVNEVVLPLGVKTAVFTKTDLIPSQRTVEQAKEEGKKQMDEYRNNTFSAEQVKNTEITYQVTQDGVMVKSKFFCIENIIFCEKLLIF